MGQGARQDMKNQSFCFPISPFPTHGMPQVEYKSAPIPEDNKDEGVTVVVGKTVDSIVFDENKDVLIEASGACIFVVRRLARTALPRPSHPLCMSKRATCRSVHP